MLKMNNSLLMILLGVLIISSYLNLRSLTLCVLVSYLTTHFTKNITVILCAGLLVSFLVNARQFMEGMENSGNDSSNNNNDNDSSNNNNDNDSPDNDNDNDNDNDKFEEGKDLYELRKNAPPVESTDKITPTDVFIKKNVNSCSDVVKNMVIGKTDVKKLKSNDVDKYKPVLITSDGKCNVDKNSLVVFDAEGDGKTIKDMISGTDDLTDKYLIVKSDDKHYAMKADKL